MEVLLMDSMMYIRRNKRLLSGLAVILMSMTQQSRVDRVIRALWKNRR
jgi:hypothetical protein